MTSLEPTASKMININDLDEMLGTRPILPSEDHKAYDQLTYKFRAAISPKDIVEEILVRDVIDLTWEVQRLKNYKNQILQFNQGSALEKVFDQIFGYGSVKRELIDKWKKGDPEEKEKVNQELTSRGFEISVVDAMNFRLNIGDIERIDRLIMQAEARRMAHLREVQRHRSFLAEIMREAIAAHEDSKVIEHNDEN
jgi:hypothetical protein